jgi:hypothetical protein
VRTPSASLKKAASGRTFVARKPSGWDRRSNAPAARPEAVAAQLVRIGFVRHCIRQARHAAGMARRGAAGEARHREFTELALPRKPVRNCLNMRSQFLRI